MIKKTILVRPDGSRRVASVNEEPSLTQQSFAEETNINSIMKKYHATGMVTHLNRRKGAYVDLSTVKDYRSSLQAVIDAQASFMTVPSEIRKRFSNDPQELINFLNDPNNRDEAIKLGLLNSPAKKNDDSNDDKNADKKS